MKIKINGKDMEVSESALTYQQIVDLADTSRGKSALHSIMYGHRVPFNQLPGERSGMVCPGQSVPVTEGMHIEAIVTDSA